MKVGFITFHNGSNYGAALQAFALQEAEKILGNEVYLINYDNRFISKGLDCVRFGFSVLGLYSFLTDIINYSTNGRKIKRFKDFFDRYYTLSALKTASQLKSTEESSDLGISGSDQIWNPNLNNKVDDIYFLNFGNFKNKISYGSSLGNYSFDNSKYNSQIKEYLSCYDRLSTREKSAKLGEIIGKPVTNVCDPTLLLDKNNWEKKLEIRRLNPDYLLVYSLTDSDHVLDIAKQIADKRGLKVVCIGRSVHQHKGVNYILDAGSKEFVELFFNAGYVVTNSFHGTAFSINFNKQFLSIKHPKSPERAEHILFVTGLQSRLITQDSDIFKEDIDPTLFDIANKSLDELRAKSYRFLEGK